MYLAGQLLHRGAQSEDERRAAEFIQRRFQEFTADVELDEFVAVDNYAYLFASYYTESLVVAVLATFGFPIFAAAYGCTVFLAYLAEFMGHPVFSRFMPKFESQNVIARILATQPQRLFIVAAHYDSGAASPLTSPRMVPWLRPLHRLFLFCMVAVIATCAAEGAGFSSGGVYPLAVMYVRWSCVGVLLSAALSMFYASSRNEDIRGANNNASGVAALLRLGQRLAEKPIESADVWLVAAGSNEAWMSGMRHFLSTQKPDKRNTYILNVEGVGAGTLHYLTAEGILHRGKSDRSMVAAAEETASAFGVTPAVMRAVPSAAHIPMARGYHATTLMGLDGQGRPRNWNWYTDLVTEVEESTIAQAADFAEALLRRLGDDLSPPRP